MQLHLSAVKMLANISLAQLKGHKMSNGIPINPPWAPIDGPEYGK